MRNIFFNKTILIFLLIIGSFELSANNSVIGKEFTKSIKKEFDITDRGSVNIHNRHGKVNINTWDKGKVKIEVTIIVNARKESSAQEVFDRIHINFSNGSEYVTAETSIEAVKKSWIWWGYNNSNDYTINYEVYMPKTCALDLRNKYGDTYVQDLASSAEVSVAYGNINMGAVDGRLNITLAYGNATIADAGEVDLQIKHSKIRLKKIEDISLQSKYSTVSIEEAKDIQSTSKYDTYKFGSIDDFRNQGKYDNIDIGTAKNLTVVTKYTDLHAEAVSNSCNFEFKYGGARINEMGQEFSEIMIQGSYADFKFGIPQSADYKLDAHGKYAGIRYPSDLDVVFEKDKGSTHEIKAYKGGKMASSLIKARLSYGGLKLIKF